MREFSAAAKGGMLGAQRIPGAWVEIVDGVGHMPWMEHSGCVRPALERLVAG
jgi:pimeloyl-ACP methyl ester carboxylesterase